MLFTADLHISNNLPYAKKSPKTLVSDRLRDLIEVIDWIVNEAVERSCPLFILGDIFDRRQPDAISLKTAASIFKSAVDAGIEIYILPGNHDAHDSKGLHYVVDMMEAFELKGLTVLKAKKVLKLNGINFCPLPFMPKLKALDILKSYQNIPHPKVLLLHDSIIGCKNRGYVMEEGFFSDELDGFDHIISGHIHQAQKLIKLNGCYVGSPYQRDFGETDNNPIITILNVERLKTSLESIPIPLNISTHFCTQTSDDGANWTVSGHLKYAKYLRFIFTGSDSSFRHSQLNINEKIEENKKGKREISVIHRAKNVNKSRLQSTNIVSGLPPIEQLIKDYVDLEDRKNNHVLIQAGLELLHD